MILFKILTANNNVFFCLKSKWLETMIMFKILMAKNNGFVENPQRLETNDFYRPVKAKNRH